MGLSIASIALSGMNAGLKRLEVSADNIARRNVPNSEKNRVVQTERAQGGVDTQAKQIPLPQEMKTENNAFDLSTVIASNIDYAEEAVEKIVANIATQSSLAVYKRAAETENEILNLTT